MGDDNSIYENQDLKSIKKLFIRLEFIQMHFTETG